MTCLKVSPLLLNVLMLCFLPFAILLSHVGQMMNFANYWKHPPLWLRPWRGASDKLRDLAKVPFNTRLLAELVFARNWCQVDSHLISDRTIKTVLATSG
ncbi:Uncharacterised protein [Salmonella enterica subsp. enterica]|uniref:Uncharacterized protein n=1 Tax=Salmonella enterica I TaxID=59201 RepID=A0A447PFV7_SALET|nr:Uncharacterised protein [Salmonella enterica subsp. enterica]